MSEFGSKLKFDASGMATCPANGEKYQLKDNIVSKIS
jgi:hypothetical protein